MEGASNFVKNPKINLCAKKSMMSSSDDDLDVPTKTSKLSLWVSHLKKESQKVSGAISAKCL